MVYPKWMNARRKSYESAYPKPPNVTTETRYIDRGWPMWMDKGYRTFVLTFQPIRSFGGSGGGGMTIGYRDKPFPSVKVRKVVSMDDYDNINIKVLRIIDLSLSGGGNVDI